MIISDKRDLKHWLELRRSLKLNHTEFRMLLGVSSNAQYRSYREGKKEPLIRVWLRMKERLKQVNVELPDSFYCDTSEYKITNDEKKVVNDLLELRTELGITQDEFSEIIGVGGNTYSLYELRRTNPSVSTALKIKYYALSRGYYLDDSFWFTEVNRRLYGQEHR